MTRPVLIIFVKEPVAGRVKTRLGRDIGMSAAAWWYRHQMARTLRSLRDPRWQILVAIAPDRALHRPHWPRDLPRMAQGRGDLGARMRRALQMTPGPSLLIGSDIPGVRKHHVAGGFQALGRAPSVIGPATDGGYWLVGLKHPKRAPKALFQNTRWSHPDTLADTLLTLPGPTAMIDMLSDVDEAKDL